MKNACIWGGVAAVALIIGGVWLIAAPRVSQEPQASTPQVQRALPGRSSAVATTSTTPVVGTATATPATIVVNTPTTVTVKASITPAPILNGVNLLRLGATGTQSTILGVMHDDGKNADAVASDGIYTLQVPFNEPVAGSIQLQVSAAFQGALKRVLSAFITIPVDNVFAGTGFQFLYAADLSTAPATSTRPNVLTSTTLTDPTLQTDITITTFSNPSGLPVGSWYSQVLQGHEYAGSFSTPNQNNDVIAAQECNTTSGLLVTSEVFGNQYSRILCPTLSGQIVEFETSAADGDPSLLNVLLQLVGSFKTF